MTIQIEHLPGDVAYDLIYQEHFSMLPVTSRATMERALKNSTKVWLGFNDETILCCWGLISPTLLSDRAYLWLYTTEAMHEHVFLFVRHSQRAVDEMLQHYPIIVGHAMVGADHSIRWLRWLGAKFGEPDGKVIPFEIRAKSWPQA